MKKLFFTLFTVAMLCLLPTAALAADADYIDENGAEQMAIGATELTQAILDADTPLDDEWYVVQGSVAATARIQVQGDVKLILADGAVLTATAGGISVNAGDSLTVYGQGGNTGKIVAQTDDVYAAIGGDDGKPTTLAFYGGVIEATTVSSGAAIGSGDDAGGTTITIGGQAKVTATTNGNGAAIGSGRLAGDTTTITIGGQAELTATANGNGAAIGSGQAANDTTITIGGQAEVTATATDLGAAIGNGSGAMVTTVTIEDNAKVDATSIHYGAAIGGDFTAVTIRGEAVVEAITEGMSAAIGTGAFASGTTTVTIGGQAKVNATTTKGSLGAAIGTGFGHDTANSLLITLTDDAEITAKSNAAGAAIGSGSGNAIVNQQQTAVITLIIEKNAQVKASASEADVAGIGFGSGTVGAGSDQQGSVTTHLHGGTYNVSGDPMIEGKAAIHIEGYEVFYIEDASAYFNKGYIRVELPDSTPPTVTNPTSGLRGSTNYFSRNLNLRYVQVGGESIQGIANPVVTRRIAAVGGHALVEIGLTAAYEDMLTVRIYVGTMYEGKAFTITHTTSEGTMSYSATCDEDGYVAVMVDALGTFETRLA